MFCFRIRGYHSLGLCFPAHSANKTFCNFFSHKWLRLYLTTPSLNRMECVTCFYTRFSNDTHRTIKTRFGLFPFRSPLLRKCCTQYVYFVLFSSWYWNVLLPRVCSLILKIRVTEITLCGVSSFGNFRIKACSAAPRNYRRYTTSFIASQKPRHPPYALKFPIRKFKNHLTDVYTILI